MRSGPQGDPERAEIYRRFLDLLGGHTCEMNEFLVSNKDLLSADHFSHLKLMVGMVLGHGHMPVIEEICQKYPVLKPDWMK